MSSLSDAAAVPAPRAYLFRAGELLVDLVLMVFAYYGAYQLRFDSSQFQGNYPLLVQSLPIVLGCGIASFFFVGVYRTPWRPFHPADGTTYFRGVVLGAVSSILVLLYVYRFASYSRVVFIIGGALFFFLAVGSRIAIRALARALTRQRVVAIPVMIYGAGELGTLLAKELVRNPRRGYVPVGFIDDDPNKEGRRFGGLRVLGGISGLPEALDRVGAESVILSTRKIRPVHLSLLHQLCADSGTSVLAMRFTLDPVEIDGAGSIRRFPAPIESPGRHRDALVRLAPVSTTAAAGQLAYHRSGPRPLRVAQVATRLNLGGVTRHILNLYRHMPAGRVEMRVIAGTVNTGETEWIEAIRDAGVMPWMIPELRRPVSLTDDLVALYKLWRFFRRWKPDIVHTHMAKAGALGRIAALLAGVPVRVHSFHGNVFRGYFGTVGSWATRTVERMLGHVTTGIITVTPGQQHEIVGDLRIVSEHRTRLIPYGCDTGGTVSPDVRESWRRELGIEPGTFVVVSVGRLTFIKNHALLLDALARCQMPMMLVIVGDGELRAELETQARALGITHRVIFAGRIEDVTVAYQIADVVTLTSRNEGAPIAIMEAMGWGLPVVATRVGGVPDLVDKSSGILVDEGDSDALAAALDGLAQDRERARRMGAAARARAVAEFSVDREVQSILDLYEGLVASSDDLNMQPPRAFGPA
jgi:glycosyltransferase involved in cell wall biosynthesis